MSAIPAMAASTSGAVLKAPIENRTPPSRCTVPSCVCTSGAQCRPVRVATLWSTSSMTPTSPGSTPSRFMRMVERWFSNLSQQYSCTPSICLRPSTSLCASCISYAVFTEQATSCGPVSYQWYLNTNALAEQTNATLTVTNVQLADAGSYLVTLANAAGSSTSA